MKKDLSFENACQIIKGEYPELVNDIDKFSSVILAAGTTVAAIPIAIAVGPTAITPAAIILIAVGTLSNLLGVKNEISTISEKIIVKIANKRDKDTLKLFERMQHAFSLTCYTSFFEALNQHEHLSPLLKKIKLTGEEKHSIAVYAAKDLLGRSDIQTANVEMDHIKFEIDLPQPGDTLQTQRRRLLPLYQQLAKRAEKFFELETVKRQIQESGGQEKVEKALKGMPEKAIEYFRAQYYGLAMKYPEFAIWLNLQENEKSRTLLQEEGAEYNRKLIDLAENGQKAIDIGFRHMEEIIKSIPSQIEQEQTDTILQRLETWYINTVEKPIIDDPYSAYSQPTLTYPKKSDIFVPQAFQALHYTGQEHLEREQTWKDLPERDDLSAFLLGYFSHPISIHKPLIILGQPGSGKSLLTSMLAARLVASASSYTPIKVELRHVNAEASISVQIKDQVYKDTLLERSWGELTSCSINRPPLVIFDGYDELLQATGKIFSGYLKDVEAFQEDELTRKQTVRAVVTSRINLIDKAVIPKHATVVRLLKFNTQRQNEWISRWNDTNAVYFEQAQVKPLTLPQMNKSIEHLAEQPLLLMMLAIYDSVGNPLLSTKDLDQTLLYDELLRRFIERELKKDEKISRSWQKEELDKAVDYEMDRLGVAAIGMFNRRSLYIQKEDLDTDLKFFKLGKSSLEREDRRSLLAGGRDLLPAEKMFGSFFFQQLTAVYRPVEPEALEAAIVYKPQEAESDIAYEFLHNTFGEFLTADFMLRKILEETAAIRHLTGIEILKSALSQRIEQLDGLGPDWFARFMYAPLFSRPIIVKLLREWSQHLLRQKRQNIQEVLADLDIIITNHINLLLNGNTLPSLMTKNDQHPFAKLPVIGYLAIYTLNLILLRTLLAPDGFTFIEKKYNSSEDGTRAWDRLTYLWRSWFSLETLNELAAILDTERDGTMIRLKIKNTASTSSNRNRLELVNSVGQALADNITAGLSGLLLHDSFRANQASIDAIWKLLRSEQVDEPLEVLLHTKLLRHLRHETRASVYLPASTLIGSKIDWKHNLEASVFLLAEVVRLAQETNDRRVLKRYEPLVLQPEFTEESDELMRETIRLAREIEFEGAIRYFSEEHVVRLLSGKSISTRKLAKKPLPTELLIELIQIVHERGFSIIAEYIVQTYMKNSKNERLHIPTHLAVEIVKFARLVNDRSMLSYFLHHYTEMIPSLRTRAAAELTVECIKLAREVGDQETLNQLIEMCMHTLMKADEYVVDVFVRSELMTELLKYAYEINNRHFFTIFTQYIAKMIKENNIYLSSDLLAVILKFAHKIDNKDIKDVYNDLYLKSVIQAQQLVTIELAIEVIKLAIEEQNIYNQAHVKNFYHKNVTVERCHLDALPLGTVMDIRHLAQIFSDNSLVQLIDTRMRL
jgi:hypothetical protein